MLFQKEINAIIIQANGIEQAGTGFHRTGRGIADTWFCGNRLGDDSPQAGKIQEGCHFFCITKSPRSHKYGIFKMQTVQGNR